MNITRIHSLKYAMSWFGESFSLNGAIISPLVWECLVITYVHPLIVGGCAFHLVR